MHCISRTITVTVVLFLSGILLEGCAKKPEAPVELPFSSVVFWNSSGERTLCYLDGEWVGITNDFFRAVDNGMPLQQVEPPYGKVAFVSDTPLRVETEVGTHTAQPGSVDAAAHVCDVTVPTLSAGLMDFIQNPATSRGSSMAVYFDQGALVSGREASLSAGMAVASLYCLDDEGNACLVTAHNADGSMTGTSYWQMNWPSGSLRHIYYDNGGVVQRVEVHIGKMWLVPAGWAGGQVFSVPFSL
jgi:hypothetical protein